MRIILLTWWCPQVGTLGIFSFVLEVMPHVSYLDVDQYDSIRPSDRDFSQL